MRLPALTLVLAALYSCGQGLDCPDARAFNDTERMLFTEVATLAEFPQATEPALAEQDPDPTCPSSSDIRTSSGDCVGAYYLSRCDCVVLPTIGTLSSWWYARFIRHESLHAILQQRYGDPDRARLHTLWSKVDAN